MKVAVLGTGIAGNAAAWTLSKRYQVTAYDRELRLEVHRARLRAGGRRDGGRQQRRDDEG